MTPSPAGTHPIEFDAERLRAFCERWGVRRLSVFGSRVNGTAKADSDLDIAVRVAEGSRTSYWDWPEMMEELKGIFSAEIDLISEGGINNPYFRAEFERTRRVLYDPAPNGAPCRRTAPASPLIRDILNSP